MYRNGTFSSDIAGIRSLKLVSSSFRELAVAGHSITQLWLKEFRPVLKLECPLGSSRNFDGVSLQ